MQKIKNNIKLLIIVCCLLTIKTIVLNTIIINSMKETVLVDFGKKIKELRSLKKISQEELADLAGVHRTYIGMIERAEKNITLLNIEKIANALNINIKDLFDAK